jgi:hypothetical protein
MFIARFADGRREQLRELAALPGLMRIVPCHGHPIEQAPADTLRSVADSLG